MTRMLNKILVTNIVAAIKIVATLPGQTFFTAVIPDSVLKLVDIFQYRSSNYKYFLMTYTGEFTRCFSSDSQVTVDVEYMTLNIYKGVQFDC